MRTITLRALFFTLSAFFFSSLAFGQSYQKGDKLLNIGAGFGSQFMASGATGAPPVGLSLEFGATDKISIGVYGGYAGATVETAVGDWDYTYIIAGGRGSYHFDFGGEKLDPYLGVLLGYNIASVNTSSNLPAASTSAGGFIWGGHAGARYLLGPKFGVFAELGYGVAWLTGGISLKF